MSENLDSLDLKIIDQLRNDGRISITELAKNVKASRPTVTSRLKRLTDDGLVVIAGGINLQRLGFKIACVGLEVKSEGARRRLEEVLKDCPRVLNIFRTPEKANIHLSVWGEDDSTINSTIESFRDIENVDVIYTHYLGTPIHGKITVNVPSEKRDRNTCKKDCSSCESYKKGWCFGCPITAEYKNPFLKN